MKCTLLRDLKETIWEWRMLNRYQYGFTALRDMDNDFGEKQFNGETFYSQFRQDIFLRYLLFPDKNDGVFLDVGGNHPITINNTYYFEKIGWTGLAFEPTRKNNSLWPEKRSTPCLPVALGQQEAWLEFVEYEDDTMSGLKDNVHFEGKVKDTYQVKVRLLKDVLKEHDIKKVDFMSLDVEGGELDVLKGIDFEAVDINCILIENDKSGKKERKIRNFLRNHGYYLYARLLIDDVWVKRR